MKRWIRFVCMAVVCVLNWQLSNGTAQDRNPFYPRDRGEDRAPLPSGRPLTEDERVRIRQEELLLNYDAETSPDHGASIDERLMRTVKDCTVGIRYEEREAYLRILRLALEVPIHRLEEFASEIQIERRETVPSYRNRRLHDFPQFVDLFTHPEFYRGRPVTLHGVMRKVTKFDLGKNRLELDQAYEGWVYTPDCQGNPAVVVFTSNEQIPVSGDIQEEVKFTGYYFKMYGYDAYDTTRKAPLIIAGAVERIHHRQNSIFRGIHPAWYGMAALGFVVGCYLVWQTNQREMPPRPPAQIEPDFNHFPPRVYPALDSHLHHSVAETEDS